MKVYVLIHFVLLNLMVACNPPEKKEASAIIDSVKNVYAPDKRVALLDVHWERGELTGETNLPKALEQLETSLSRAGISSTNKVNLLPDTTVTEKEGVVTISVANLRGEPRHSAELVTQATMGTPIKVLKRHGGWWLVQTPDQYIAWVDNSGVATMSAEEMSTWMKSNKVVFTGLIGYVYADTDEEEMVSDLTAGNILLKSGEDIEFTGVVLPDGRKGYVKNEEIMTLDNWTASRNISAENLIQTAKSMMGVPYLWGGTSVKGVDCSGFTKTVYFLNGLVIPRDASQQVHEGKLVDSTKNWQNLQVGDLLFFGRPASQDKPERVVHVGMWIGDSSFIHSSGRVQISSVNEKSEYYDEYNLKRYLRSGRIKDNQTENIISVARMIN